jgi:GDP-4-dehydro-6-deoxy-D-mannose reductase
VALAAVPLEIEPDPDRMRPSELPVVCGDASRLRAATAWAPKIPLEQTLADMLEAARREATERMAST